jgi:SHS2 domain-containing protein
MPGVSFEMVEHTGDLAIRLRAPDLGGLIRAGLYALRALLFEGEPASDAPQQRGEARVSGVDREDILVQSLSEGLHLMQDRALFPHTLRVEVAGDGEARLWLTGVRADGQQLRQVEEIKAVTYHAVEIRERDEQLETLVVLDV